MEPSFSCRDQRSSSGSSSQAQMEGFALPDDGTGNMISDDPFNLIELMDLDSYAELFGLTTVGDQVLPSFSLSASLASQSLPGSFPAFSPLHFSVESNGISPVAEGSFIVPTVSSHCRDKLSDRHASAQFGLQPNSLDVQDSNTNAMGSVLPLANVSEKNITGILYRGAGDASQETLASSNICTQFRSVGFTNPNIACDQSLTMEHSLRGANCCEEEPGPSFSNVAGQDMESTVRKNLGCWNCLLKTELGSAAYEKANSMIYRSLGPSLTEKMLKALSLFRESSGEGILAQVWVPVKQGDEYVLSTCDQPYLLDQILAGYREISRSFTFSAVERPGSFPGLPGRVFISRMPEWTSNVGYYSKAEYLRVNHALNHEVRGSLALPIFDPHERSCCAVLELVTKKEVLNFDPEMENVCHALRAVQLTTMAGRDCSQYHPKSQIAVLAEIGDILRAVCHAHKLPLALTWTPCKHCDVIDCKHCSKEHGVGSRKTLLGMQDSACCVNDVQMQGFVLACSKRHLETGQGIAGKALESNHPFFCADVKEYNIREYPLAHHARRFGLNAAVAIRLRSTHTSDDDYILEFFLPVNCKGSSEQNLLLHNLSTTMQKICMSLRTVSDTEMVRCGDVKVGIQKGVEKIFSSVGMPRRSSQSTLSENELDSSEGMARQIQSCEFDELEADMVHEQGVTCSRKQPERKPSTVEKNISLSVLQQYFSGSLKDAAKSIGVCPTTLKRICRQHGISRWPSRKINKVNRSLKKIQTVIDSVQGVEGALRYDPITGGLIATSLVQDPAVPNPFHSTKNPTLRNTESEAKYVNSIFSIPSTEETKPFTGKLKRDHCALGGNKIVSLGNESISGPRKTQTSVASINSSDESKFAALAPIDGTRHAFSKDNSRRSCLASNISNRWDSIKDGTTLESSDCHVMSRTSSTMAAEGELDDEVDAEDGVEEPNQPASSGMTDSSDSSGSMMNCSATSFPTSPWQKCLKSEYARDDSMRFAVKATYKEDTVRFKFMACMGSLQLFEEVGERFKLPVGTFQLKYLDDEEEWVILASDADLQECIEIMISLRAHSVKVLVRDLPCAVGSSASSSGGLLG